MRLVGKIVIEVGKKGDREGERGKKSTSFTNIVSVEYWHPGYIDQAIKKKLKLR